MSKTEERLKAYKLQMSIYTQQHQMLLASDVLDMIEQLQDDLKDDVNAFVEQLNGKLKELYAFTILEEEQFDEMAKQRKAGDVD